MSGVCAARLCGQGQGVQLLAFPSAPVLWEISWSVGVLLTRGGSLLCVFARLGRSLFSHSRVLSEKHKLLLAIIHRSWTPEHEIEEAIDRNQIETARALHKRVLGAVPLPGIACDIRGAQTNCAAVLAGTANVGGYVKSRSSKRLQIIMHAMPTHRI